MSELIRIALMLVLGAAAVTLAVTLAAAWLSEERRLGRVFRAGLGARPDAALIAHGAGRGVALSLAADQIVTVWDGGRWRLAYPLAAVTGAEIDIDGEIAARVMRGEARRRLERPGAAQREVRLILGFDDARHPDFELVLWPRRPGKRGPQSARDAAGEANRWLSRVEALLKRSGEAAIRAPKPASVRTARPAPPGAPPPWEDRPELFGDDDDAVLEAEDEL